MREDSPRWEEINPSGFAHEKDGLRELASYLPDADPYHVWHTDERPDFPGSPAAFFTDFINAELSQLDSDRSALTILRGVPELP